MPDLTKVHLIGCGPGNPTLLSRRAEYLIRQADIVFYDRLVHPFIVQLARPSADLIYVGKTPYSTHITQEKIHKLMVDAAQSGKNVVRLKGGDPAIFGRVHEEVQALKLNNISWEITPGITASSSAVARLGIGLTGREVSANVTLTTGHFKFGTEGESHIQSLLDGGTVALYMGVKKLDKIMSEIQQETKEDYPVAVIIQATLHDERIITGTVTTIAEKLHRSMNVYQPAIIIIGQVVHDITFPIEKESSYTLIHGSHYEATHYAFNIYQNNKHSFVFIQPTEQMSDSYQLFLTHLKDKYSFAEVIHV